MSDIFISYARQDKQTTEILAEALKHQGWSVWWDIGIPAGSKFDEAIEEQLQAAKCVVVLWSQTSIKSDWVKNEAREGKARGVLIPVLIEDVRMPLEFRGLQVVRLLNWKGNSTPEFNEILKSIKQLIGGNENFPAKEQERLRNEQSQAEQLSETSSHFLAMLIVFLLVGLGIGVGYVMFVGVQQSQNLSAYEKKTPVEGGLVPATGATIGAEVSKPLGSGNLTGLPLLSVDFSKPLGSGNLTGLGNEPRAPLQEKPQKRLITQGKKPKHEKR